MVETHSAEGNSLQVRWDTRVVTRLHVMLETVLQLLDGSVPTKSFKACPDKV